jgi:hypothetical protein
MANPSAARRPRTIKDLVGVISMAILQLGLSGDVKRRRL